jgi:endogenous inhibitor of DNA gyrase (YacG/DUF329 family)
MAASTQRSTWFRVGAIVFVVLALGFSGVSWWSQRGRPRGTESDLVLVSCSECNTDSELTSRAYGKLRRDPQTRKLPCPNCGKAGAELAALRCPHCNRGVPRQSPDKPFACPHCSKSLNPFEGAQGWGD